MKTSRLILTCILLSFVVALPAVAGPRTFVSGLGNDANPTREQPKRTFASALTVTNPGGQIVALDSAGYASSTLTINKSVSIIVPPGVAGFITVSGANDGITINAAATDVVSIRGLIIENSSRSASPSGIRSNSVGTLRVEDCAVRNFNYGILFYPSNEGHLQVHGGSARQNVFGIYLAPSTAVPVDGIVTDCRLENNGYGLFVNAANGGTARLTAGDCTISGNGIGIYPAGEITSFGNNSFAYNGENGFFTNTTPRF